MKSGRYFSESEVVAEALSAFKVREAIRHERLAELRAKVQVGIDQAERGDFVEFTAEDIIKHGREGLDTFSQPVLGSSVEERAASGSWEDFDRLMSPIPDSVPAHGDRLLPDMPGGCVICS